jgi:chemotaxis response regulator CheB
LRVLLLITTLVALAAAPARAGGSERVATARAFDRLVIVASSLGGREVVPYVFSRVAPRRSAIVIYPHLAGDAIYRQLRHAGVKPIGVDRTTELSAGGIYVVGHRDISAGAFGRMVGLQGRTLTIDKPRHWRAFEQYLDRGVNQLLIDAAAHGQTCAAVILSGSGRDGAAGAAKIARNGGALFAQIERPERNIPGYDARDYNGAMPLATVATTSVDYAGPADGLVHALSFLLASPWGLGSQAPARPR